MIKYKWVKRVFSKKEWNECYSGNTSYCFLEMLEGEPVAGFLMTKQDGRCKPCTLDDLRRIDSYRRANHIYPFPLEDYEPKELEDIDVDKLDF